MRIGIIAVGLAVASATSMPAPAAADPVFRVVDLPPPSHAAVARVLYLNRCTGGCTITKSASNDARRKLSSLPGDGSVFTLGELAWSAADWGAVLQCVREVYSPYAIEVTDVEPPANVLYNEGVVAGRAGELGLDGVAGISALADDCSPYANFMSFVFANNNPGAFGDIHWLCWAIAHETGHAFGLDHAYVFDDGTSACRDPMSYRTDCGGQRFFRPDFAKCGDFAARACKCGATQSSHYQLLGVLGAGTPITAAPVAEVTTPIPGVSIRGPIDVVVEASAQRGIATVHLYINGANWMRWPGAPWDATGQSTTHYVVPMPAAVPDGIMDIVVDVRDDLGTSTRTAPITITKGEPCISADTCAAGQRCDAGRCLWDPPAGEFGESCEFPQYCKSGICAGGDVGVCTSACNLDLATSCPAGWSCHPNPPANFCLPDEPGGCTGSPAPALPLVLLALAFAVTRAKRRRSAATRRR